MKHFRFCLLLFLPLALACSRKAYDVSDGFNTDLTLFENEISVPVGSVGPFTLGLIMDKLSQIEGIGSLLANYLKTGKDGALYLEDTGNIFSINVYELEKQLPDADTATSWNAGNRSAYIGGVFNMLGFLGLKVANQHLVITASNPLWASVQGSCSPMYKSPDYSAPIDGMDSFSLPESKTVELASQTLPDHLSSPVMSLELANLTLSLPANPVSRIYNNTGNLLFSFDYKYTASLAIGEAFILPLEDISLGDVNLAIGQFGLKQCQLSLELENTLPLQVKINDIVVYQPKASENEEAVVDENIVIASDFTIAGGSLEHPSTTQLNVGIEALEGTIPDLREVHLNLSLAAQPDLGVVALSTKQGLYVKNASAKLSGGITIPIKNAE